MIRRLLTCVLLCLAALAQAQQHEWREFAAAGVTIEVASDTDAAAVPRIASALALLLPELHERPGFAGCSPARLVIHPDLDSYLLATGTSWHQLASADVASCRVHLQRIQVVELHGGLERSLRHEFFHLFQPRGLERWRAEGEAQRFAGEQPAAEVLRRVSPAELDLLLAAPPDELTRLRAMATALQWVFEGR